MIANAAPRKPTKKGATDRLIEHRWTPRLAREGWTPICDFFLVNYHRLKVSHTEAMVVIHLMSFKWDTAQPYPALKTIAKRMGITVPSVRTHLRNLENKGLLHRNFRTGTTTRFDLQPLFNALERLMTQDKETKTETADDDQLHVA